LSTPRSLVVGAGRRLDYHLGQVLCCRHPTSATRDLLLAPKVAVAATLRAGFQVSSSLRCIAGLFTGDGLGSQASYPVRLDRGDHGAGVAGGTVDGWDWEEWSAVMAWSGRGCGSAPYVPRPRGLGVSHMAGTATGCPEGSPWTVHHPAEPRLAAAAEGLSQPSAHRGVLRSVNRRFRPPPTRWRSANPTSSAVPHTHSNTISSLSQWFNDI
jgi:hypothetical protein